MKRLINVSFLFLGWGFYELSGGSEFEPRVANVPPPEATATTDMSEDTQGSDATPATIRSAPAQATEMVARPAIGSDQPVPAAQGGQDETSADVVTRASSDPVSKAIAEVLAEAEAGADTDAEDDRLGQVRSSLNQGLSLFNGSAPAQPMTLASLEEGAAGLAVSDDDFDADTASNPAFAAARLPEDTEPAAPPPDIREITGSRVNMRDGPGTIYPVITKLTVGKEVEVLDDSGTGWLRLQTLPEKQIGWIAASLVSKAPR